MGRVKGAFISNGALIGIHFSDVHSFWLSCFYGCLFFFARSAPCFVYTSDFPFMIIRWQSLSLALWVAVFNQRFSCSGLARVAGGNGKEPFFFTE